MLRTLALGLSFLTTMLLAGCQADAPTSMAGQSAILNDKSEAIVVDPEAARFVMQRIQGEALVRPGRPPAGEPVPSLAGGVSADESALRVRLHRLGEFRGVQRPDLSPNVANVRVGARGGVQ